MSSEIPLIRKLIELTNSDKIRWENRALDIHSAVYENNEITVEFPQDEPPYILFNGKHFQMRGVGIEALLSDIRKQYERQDRNGQGPTAKKEQGEASRKRDEEASKQASEFQAEANKFLESENKKKRR